MRQHFNLEPDFAITPIEKILLPLQSRDELPPILAALQWIWMQATLKAQILGLLEARILAGKKATGRTGMDLWQILVLGVVVGIGVGPQQVPRHEGIAPMQSSCSGLTANF